MLKKEDRFCQFDPVTKYLEKTGDQFDNAVVYFIGHGFQYSEDADLSKQNLIAQGAVAVTVIELIT